MKEENIMRPGNWMIIVAILLAAILIVGAYSAGVMGSQRVVVSSDSAPNIKTLSVSGSVTKMVSPDKVDIVLAVETLDASAQKSQSDNAVTSDKVRQALAAAGVAASDIKTVSYSVNEQSDWNELSKSYDAVGFRTVNQIQITLTDTTKAGKVVDAAVTAGANRVSSISFGLSKERELAIRTSALNEASATARVKANSIAQGLGITIGKVYSVTESSFYYTPNYANYVAKDAMPESAPTPISAGDVEVNATVSVSFELN
jgi:uncharacterized protein YggE